MVESLGLSYRNAQELNQIIDEEMSGWPKFHCEEIHLGGESYDFFFRDITLWTLIWMKTIQIEGGFQNSA